MEIDELIEKWEQYKSESEAANAIVQSFLLDLKCLESKPTAEINPDRPIRWSKILRSILEKAIDPVSIDDITDRIIDMDIPKINEVKHRSVIRHRVHTALKVRVSKGIVTKTSTGFLLTSKKSINNHPKTLKRG